MLGTKNSKLTSIADYCEPLVPDFICALRLLRVLEGAGVGGEGFGQLLFLFCPRTFTPAFFPTSTLSLLFSPSPSDSSEKESAEFPDITEIEKYIIINHTMTFGIRCIYLRRRDSFCSLFSTLTVKFKADVFQAHPSEQHSVSFPIQHDAAHSAHQRWVLANPGTALCDVILVVQEVLEPLLLSFVHQQKLCEDGDLPSGAWRCQCCRIFSPTGTC